MVIMYRRFIYGTRSKEQLTDVAIPNGSIVKLYKSVPKSFSEDMKKKDKQTKIITLTKLEWQALIGDWLKRDVKFY